MRQAPGSPAAALPAGLIAAVRAELRRVLHPPFEVPLIVGANGGLLVAVWFLAPPRLMHLLFTFHGPLGFPMALAGWMYSDVPATNQLGADPGWALATIFTLLWIGVVPLGALGLSAWVGILLPYHPMPLRRRWAHRRPYRRQLRWIVLVVVPYGLVPLAVLLLSVPTLALWFATVGLHRQQLDRFTDRVFAWGVGLGAALAVAAWLGGVRASALLAQRRADRPSPFLADPDRG